MILAEWAPVTEQNRLLAALGGSRGWAVQADTEEMTDEALTRCVFLAVDEMAALLWHEMEQTRF